MAGFNFADRAVAIALRDMVAKREVNASVSGESRPELSPNQFRNAVFVADEEIAAASLDGASSEFNFGECSMYTLTGSTTLELVSMDVTVNVINPSAEAIPSGTVIWGLLAYGNVDGTSIYVANIWSC